MGNSENFGLLNINDILYKTRISSRFSSRKIYTPADPKLVKSFIPGTVTDLFVSEGQTVQKGDLLLILDAMKMQNRLKSSMDGTIKSIFVKKGDKVSRGFVLLEFE